MPELQQDYYNLIKTIGSREAITRRFLIIFEYEPTFNNRKTDYNEVVSTLETAARTARQYFLHCDNVVVSHDDENAFLLELLYTIFNRETSESVPVEKRIQQAQIYQATHAPGNRTDDPNRHCSSKHRSPAWILYGHGWTVSCLSDGSVRWI